MTLVAKSLGTRDAQIRSAALEALDVLGDKQLVQALLPLLEDMLKSQERNLSTTETLETAFRQLVSQPDRWPQALAIRAAGELEMRVMIPDLYGFAANSDAVISGAARDALFQLGGKDGDLGHNVADGTGFASEGNSSLSRSLAR
jgi:HEAT repeat protein